MTREEEHYAAALAVPPADRAAYLQRVCNDDVDLRSRLENLLSANDEADAFFCSPPVDRPTVVLPERPGDRINRYKLLQQIGEGGCGVVYMAEQEEPVRRRVALKVIKLGMDTKAVIARFEAERQALAMMNHPHIAKVHDAGSTDTGRPYFVMELVRGIPITKYCDEHQVKPAARLELFIKVCQAVQHAHQKGIIHRDLKPSNILVTTNDGQPTPMVIDFGIAKATQGRLTDATVFTAFEQFIGTPVYMSPEQAEMTSVDIDTRSDIYSLGVLLYELLTGRPPFDPKTFAQASVEHIRQQIREKEPPRPSTRWRTLAEAEQTAVARLRGSQPLELTSLLRGDLDWIVMRCLEKDRMRRYETANALAMDLQRHLRNEPVSARPPSTAYLLQKLVRRHRFAFAAAGAVLIVIIAGALTTAAQATRALRAEREQTALREATREAKEKETAARHAAEAEQLRAEKQRWVRQQMLPEIERLVKSGEMAAAFVQVVEAEKHLTDDPALAALRSRVSLATSIETTPVGAEILWKPYRNPKAEWQSLGRSPLKDVRLARDMLRFLVRHEGHEPIERSFANIAANRTRRWSLDRLGEVPPGMVRVGGRSVEERATDPVIFGAEVQRSRPLQIDDFFLDRYEVTNRQFKAFVDRGGYENPAWWKQPFLRDGKELNQTEAMALFHDSTGRPGPATWRDGLYPKNEEDHPVTGVSWFEASAYAESMGKRLPTIHHWNRAAGNNGEYVVQLSNFSGQGPVSVGVYQGLSNWGAYDLAGNVKEWCWNEAVGDRRYILGADSSEPAYMFSHRDAQSPWDRSAMNGFRCMSLPLGSAVDPKLEAAEEPSTRDFSKEQPVGDAVFRAYRDMYAYVKTPLEARVETVDESLDWARREKVVVNAAYGDERLPVWVYLPRKAAPPYQAVVFFPGSGAMSQRNLVLAEPFFVESGRALILPVFKGLYDRGQGPASRYLNDSNLFSDLVIHCAKDLSRTMDYLETRSDIRADKVAYFGTSLGAAIGSVLLGVESRIKAAVLVSGGINPRVVPPQVDQINFVPRVRMPTLMLNGRYDFIFTEPAQQQLFRLIGVSPEHKRLVTVELGHVVRTEIRSKETLAWLDRYLGPVK